MGVLIGVRSATVEISFCRVNGECAAGFTVAKTPGSHTGTPNEWDGDNPKMFLKTGSPPCVLAPSAVNCTS